METETLLLSNDQHKWLMNHKNRIQSYYNVQINIPDFDGETCTSNDVIFGTITGQQAHAALDFLEKEMDASQQLKEFTVVDDIPIIMLDDDDNKLDAPTISVLAKKLRKKNKIKNQKEKTKRKNPYLVKTKNPCLSKITKKGKEKTLGNKKKKNKNPCSTSSSSNDTKEKIKADDVQSVPRLIPPTTARVLRPIVIDGHNVAKCHGNMSNSISIEGIQICVDYFLKRGHTQVTALLSNHHSYPDRRLNHKLLTELVLKEYVVYTPNRNVNGIRTFYTEKFLVQLALETGGVIVSNNQWRFLTGISEDFRKVITERVLKFCFVGDVFMVPDDPYGRHGPRLEEFLSFPPVESDEVECINLS